jgi:hypothetical protein
MRYIRKIALYLVPLMFLSLTGCGSETTSSNSPFSNTGSGTIFGNISTATGKTGITLNLSPTTVDSNNGQVLATAKLVSNGVAVSAASVTFSIVAPVNGPATIDPGLTTVTTDSGGEAITRITAGNVLTTTNVIVKATSTVGGQTATAYATFQIVRGAGVIVLGSNGTLGQMSKVVDPAATSFVMFLQQVPFKVTDSNGNPRVGVPVTLSVFSTIGAVTPADIVINTPTVFSDAAGEGIFNVTVTMNSPPAGSFSAASVIYQGTTNDTPPIISYVGGVYSLTTPTTP